MRGGKLADRTDTLDAEPDAVSHRRAGRWLAAAVLLCVAIAVLVDFPLRASSGYRRSALRDYEATIYGDIGQCSGGVHDAFVAYDDSIRGKLTHGIAVTYAQQAISVCSFANSGVVDLGGEQPPRSLASLHLDQLAPSADAWAYLDAFTVLQDLKKLETGSPSAAKRAAVNHWVTLADQRRGTIDALMAGAGAKAGLAKPALTLTVLQPLTGAG